MDMSKEELSMIIESAVSKAVRAHVCIFSAEEKQLLRDVAAGGKAFKRIIIYLIVGFLLVGIGIKCIPDITRVLDK